MLDYAFNNGLNKENGVNAVIEYRKSKLYFEERYKLKRMF